MLLIAIGIGLSACHSGGNNPAASAAASGGARSGGLFHPAVNYAGAQQFAAANGPGSIACADFNGDGAPDVAVADVALGVVIFFNQGEGAFQSTTSYPAGAGAFALVAEDFDGDGDTDLAMTHAVTPTLALLLNQGDGSFIAAGNFLTGVAPHETVSADFDRDGRPDLAVSNMVSHDISILLNRGAGQFEAAPTVMVLEAPLLESLAAGDLNGDGAPDLAVAENYGTRVFALLGQGDGTFTQSWVSGDTPGLLGEGVLEGIALADVNRDGRADLVTTDSVKNTASVFSGNGDGSFQSPLDAPAGGAPVDVAVSDLDGDGIPDLAVTNGSPNQIVILHGHGDGSFEPVEVQPVESFYHPQALLIADLNNDGAHDLAVAHSSPELSVLLHSSGKTGVAPPAPPDDGGEGGGLLCAPPGVPGIGGRCSPVDPTAGGT